MATTTTLDDKIASLQKRKKELVDFINFANVDIPASQAYVKKMIAEGNYDEANKVGPKIEQEAAQRDAATSELKTINETLEILYEQKKVQVDAQQAVVNQANAAANVTNSTANLTPDQILQIELAKIESNKVDAQKAAADDKAAQAASEKERTKRNYIFGAIAAVVIIVVVVFIVKNK